MNELDPLSHNKSAVGTQGVWVPWEDLPVETRLMMPVDVRERLDMDLTARLNQRIDNSVYNQQYRQEQRDFFGGAKADVLGSMSQRHFDIAPLLMMTKNTVARDPDLLSRLASDSAQAASTEHAGAPVYVPPAVAQSALQTVHHGRWYMTAPSIVTDLHQYQRVGTDFLLERTNALRVNHSGEREVSPPGTSTLRGAILADRVGLGKTLQTLSAIVQTIQAYTNLYTTDVNYDGWQALSTTYAISRAYVRGPPSLVVAPTNAIDVWANEIRRHTRGLAVAFLVDARTLHLITHPERPASHVIGADPCIDKRLGCTNNVPIRASTLLQFDVILTTYGRLNVNMPVELRHIFSSFSPFSTIGVNTTRHRLTGSRYCGQVFSYCWDDMCRPLRPSLMNDSSTLGFTIVWAMRFSWLVLDEAHALCNPAILRTRSVWTLCANNILPITATPANNHIAEMGVLLLLIRADNLPAATNFPTMRKRQEMARKRVSVKGIDMATIGDAVTPLDSVDMTLVAGSDGKDTNELDLPTELSSIVANRRKRPLGSSTEASSSRKSIAAELLTSETSRRLNEMGTDNLILMQLAVTANVLARTEHDINMRQSYVVHRHVLKYPFVNEAERILNHVAVTWAKEMFQQMESTTTTVTADGRGRRNFYTTILPIFTRAKQIAIAASGIAQPKINYKKAASGAGSTSSSSLGLNISDPSLLHFIQLPELGIRATKLQMALALLDDRQRIGADEKVVICCSFLHPLRLLEAEFRRRQIDTITLIGSVTRSERSRLIEQFRTKSNIRYALMTLKVAQSIDLTTACHMIHLDPWHNPMSQEQANGRLTRLTQKAPHVHIWYLLVAGSVEEPTHAAAERKRREADYLLHGFVDPAEATTDSLLSLQQLRLVLTDSFRSADEPLCIVDDWYNSKTTGGAGAPPDIRLLSLQSYDLSPSAIPSKEAFRTLFDTIHQTDDGTGVVDAVLEGGLLGDTDETEQHAADLGSTLHKLSSGK